MQVTVNRLLKCSDRIKLDIGWGGVDPSEMVQTHLYVWFPGGKRTRRWISLRCCVYLINWAARIVSKQKCNLRKRERERELRSAYTSFYSWLQDCTNGVQSRLTLSSSSSQSSIEWSRKLFGVLENEQAELCELLNIYTKIWLRICVLESSWTCMNSICAIRVSVV